jgi:hypothetical protein
VAARYRKDLCFGDGLARLLCLFWVGIACSPSQYLTVSWWLGLYACGRWCFCAGKSLDCHFFFSSTYASVWTSTSFLFFRPFDSEWNHWLGLVRNGHIHVLLFGPVLVFVWSSTSINDLCWFLLQLYVISLNSIVWLHPWFVSVGIYLDCKQRLWMYDEHFILTHASHSEQKWYWSLG